MSEGKLLSADGAPIETANPLDDALGVGVERNLLLENIALSLRVMAHVSLWEAQRKCMQSRELYGPKAPHTARHCETEIEMCQDFDVLLAESERVDEEGGDDDEEK